PYRTVAPPLRAVLSRPSLAERLWSRSGTNHQEPQTKEPRSKAPGRAEKKRLENKTRAQDSRRPGRGTPPPRGPRYAQPPHSSTTAGSACRAGLFTEPDMSRGFVRLPQPHVRLDDDTPPPGADTPGAAASA